MMREDRLKKGEMVMLKACHPDRPPDCRTKIRPRFRKRSEKLFFWSITTRTGNR
jgi:hypothetical protein